jgi:hypothetical protein
MIQMAGGSTTPGKIVVNVYDYNEKNIVLELTPGTAGGDASSTTSPGEGGKGGTYKLYDINNTNNLVKVLFASDGRNGDKGALGTTPLIGDGK